MQQWSGNEANSAILSWSYLEVCDSSFQFRYLQFERVISLDLQFCVSQPCNKVTECIMERLSTVGKKRGGGREGGEEEEEEEGKEERRRRRRRGRRRRRRRRKRRRRRERKRGGGGFV